MGTLVRRSGGIDHKPEWSEGSFYVIVNKDGKRTRHRLSASTLKEARAEQARLFGAGESRKADKIILGDCFRLFYESPRRRSCGIDSLSHYKAFWRRFVAFSKGESTMASSVKPATIAGFLESLRKEGLTESTVSKAYKFLCYLFRVLLDDGKLSSNPCLGVVPPRFSQKRRRELTQEELAAVIDRADGWLKSLLMVGAYTGMRLGDCASLKWSEVDLSRGVITKTPSKTKGSSGKEVRVGISRTLRDHLECLERGGEYVNPYAAGMCESHSGETVVSKKIQAHFNACGISTSEKIDGKRAVTLVGFHSLRHTWVTHQLEQGTPTTVVQMAVGHSSAQMTARYAHATPEMLRVMAERGEYGQDLRAKVYVALESCGEDILDKVARLLGVVD